VPGVEIVEPARVEERAEVPYIGIRVITPFRGMLGVRDRLLAEARSGIKEAGIETVGYGFLRLHVIDMDVLDRRTVPEGDAFACRYEAFWTDPAVESHKTRWTVELAILLAK